MAGTWSQGKDMPVGGIQMQVVHKDGKIYCIGNTDRATMEIYDIAANQWVAKEKPNFSSVCGVGILDDKLYCMSMRGLYAYNLISEIWEEITTIPTARGISRIVLSGCKLYCVGDTQADIKAMDIYDIQNDTWETGTPMPTGRIGFGCAVVDNKLYCIGGASYTADQRIHLDCVEIYDSTTNTWSTGRPMPAPGMAFGYSVVGSKIFCACLLTNTYSNAHYVYDTSTNTWSQEAATPRLDQYMGGVGVGNKMYYFGGVNGPNRTDIYTYTGDTTTTITTEYQTESGATIQANTTATQPAGDPYNVQAPAIAGYTYVGYKINGCSPHPERQVELDAVQANTTITFIYREGDDPGPNPDPDGCKCCTRVELKITTCSSNTKLLTDLHNALVKDGETKPCGGCCKGCH